MRKAPTTKLTSSKMSTKRKKVTGKRSSGKRVSSVKPICENTSTNVKSIAHTRDKHTIVADVCVLAVFMVQGSRLPGKCALEKSRELAKKISRECNSFINPATLVEESELGLFARVSKIVDLSPTYTESRAKEQVQQRDHSLMTRNETIHFLQELPRGAVGVFIADTRMEAFLCKGITFESIVAKTDGSWSILIGNDATHLLPVPTVKAELIIFESV